MLFRRISPTGLALVMLAGVLAALLSAGAGEARSRIKDIVSFEGIRGNQLVGVGVVVGLAGTGDTLRNAPFTQQMLQSAMERLGSNTRNATNIDTKDVAAVFVTADLPPFSAPGSKIDVKVSATGDAKSLLGGELLVTPLIGADGEVYAVAQGTVETGSISVTGASGSSVTRGVATKGRISNGASVERDSNFDFEKMPSLRLTLHNPDFTTASRIAAAINSTIVTLKPPPGMPMTAFVTAVEPLQVDIDSPAKVIIDQANGIVVMGEDVRISTIAIAEGNLTITVTEKPQVSQPGPFSNGQTTVTPQSTVKIDEEKGRKLITLQAGISLASLVKGLNTLGVSPRDMISILQDIKKQGALQADIEVN
jgi:flagellar P-ring protein precursor FlgI